MYAVALLKNTKTKKTVTQNHGKIRYLGAETGKAIDTKFCRPSASQDVMTPANFGAYRLRGFKVTRGRILVLVVDLFRRH